MKLQLWSNASSFSYRMDYRRICDLVWIIQKEVSILLFLLLFQVIEQLLILGSKIDNLSKILTDEPIERVSESYDFDVEGEIAAERKARF